MKYLKLNTIGLLLLLVTLCTGCKLSISNDTDEQSFTIDAWTSTYYELSQTEVEISEPPHESVTSASAVIPRHYSDGTIEGGKLYVSTRYVGSSFVRARLEKNLVCTSDEPASSCHGTLIVETKSVKGEVHQMRSKTVSVDVEKYLEGQVGALGLKDSNDTNKVYRLNAAQENWVLTDSEFVQNQPTIDGEASMGANRIHFAMTYLEINGGRIVLDDNLECTDDFPTSFCRAHVHVETQELGMSAARETTETFSVDVSKFLTNEVRSLILVDQNGTELNFDLRSSVIPCPTPIDMGAPEGVVSGEIPVACD